MKIIFLDIDGVLNSREYRCRMGRAYYAQIIDKEKMPLLKQIVEATGAKIVLSTSWRKFWNSGQTQPDPVGQQISTIFAQYGLSVYGKTPVLENAGRGEEILAWLKENRYTDGYVILDDREFGWPPVLRAHFVRTDLEDDGLSEKQVSTAIGVLQGNLLPVTQESSPKPGTLRAWLSKVLGKRVKHN